MPLGESCDFVLQSVESWIMYTNFRRFFFLYTSVISKILRGRGAWYKTTGEPSFARVQVSAIMYSSFGIAYQGQDTCSTY